MSAETEMEILTLFIGERRCAVPFTVVLSIGPYARPTRMPAAPPPIRGLLNRAGEAVPLIDAAVPFGLGLTDDLSERARIVYVQSSSSRCIGLLATGIEQLTTAEPQPVRATSIPSEFVSGVIELDGADVPLLDVQQIANACIYGATQP